MLLDAATCYRALASRDARFDGRFFTGVTSTGIYCRPICPARTPASTRVRFYACASAAEADGFRPCRRCRPDTAPGTPAWHGAPSTVARGLRLIQDGALDAGTVDQFAERLGLSARQVRRLFEAHVGASPAEIARTRRIHFARTLVDNPSMRLADIAFASGFQSVRQFNHDFRATFQCAPRAIRAKASGRGSRGDEISIRLAYRAPLDWPWLVGLLARRAAPGVERVDDSIFRRAVSVGGSQGWIEVRGPAPAGHVRSSAELEVQVSPSLTAALLKVSTGVRRLLDLDADPSTIHRVLSTDPRMADAVRAKPGLRIPGAWDPWEIAVRAVVGQQISVAAATTIIGRIVERAGTRIATPFEGVSYLFPSAGVIAGNDLLDIGMPAARVATLRRLAEHIAEGRLRLEPGSDYEQTIRALRSVQGIGPWTAEYIALRALGEPDAFPAGDLGLRRAIGNGTPATATAVAQAAEAWRPWRGYAAMYLWAGMEKIEDRR